MEIGLIAIVTVIFLLALRSYASTEYSRQVTKNLPGPFALPLAGCLLWLVTISPSNFLNISFKFMAKYGYFLRVWVFNKLFVFSGDAEFNEQLLTSTAQITKADLYKVFLPWLGDGLLTSTGHRWRNHRRIITPAFHFTILDGFLEIFDRQSSVLVDCLSKAADGKTAFDIVDYLSMAILDIFAETSMGIKVNAQSGENSEFIMATRELTELLTWRFMQIYAHSELLFTIFHPLRKLRQTKLIQITHDFNRKTIIERRKILENNLSAEKATPQLDSNDDIAAKKRMAFMDNLLQARYQGQGLSDENICIEVDTIMLGGTDTTTRALAFTLHLLARHPEVQNQVLEEIHHVYGENKSTPFSLHNLNDLKYMTCVIKESLRLCPPIPLMGRELVEDFKYTHSKVGDGVLPKGTQVIITIFNSLRDPSIYEEPSKFKPERHWDNTEQHSIYAFIPFSAGPRNCVGQKFAMYQMKVILTKILFEYEVLPLGPDVELRLGLVLRSKNGVQLGLKKRNVST